jgi:hypothetical protein
MSMTATKNKANLADLQKHPTEIDMKPMCTLFARLIAAFVLLYKRRMN